MEGKARGTIGLEPCSANFNVALSILKKRFGNSQIHTDAHFLTMTNLPAASVKSASLRKLHDEVERNLHDEVERNLRSLKALGQDIDHPLFILMITSKLPQTVMMQLTMANGDEHWDVSTLRQALGKFVHMRGATEHQCQETPNQKSEQAKHSVSSGETSTTASLVRTERRIRCFYCEGQHYSDECTEYPKVENRKTHSKLKNRCHICFHTGHSTLECRDARLCYHCSQRTHNRSLCPTTFPATSEATTMNAQAEEFIPRSTVSHSNSLLCHDEQVIMQTAMASIKTESGRSVQARILFDTGSTRTYFTEQLQKELKLPSVGEDVLSIASFCE